MSNHAIQKAALVAIAAIATIWLLQTAEAVLAPVLLALVMGVVTAPLTDMLDRGGVPRSLSAFFVLLGTLGFVLVIIVVLTPVIEDAMAFAPVLEQRLRDILATLRPAMENLSDISSSLEETLNSGDTESGPQAGEEESDKVEVPSPLAALWYAPGFLSQLLIFVGTLYFFLLSRHAVYEAIDRNATPLDGTVLAQAEAQVSRYFLTITAINAGFGTLVAIVLTVLGMPGSVVWGLVAFLVNFILYLGPMVFACVLLLAGVTVFGSAYGVLPAAVYVALNATEGQFVTPALVGKRVEVNPLLVFLSLVVWLWLWGPLGAIVAIPLLLWALRVREALVSDSAPAPRAAAADQSPSPVISGRT